MKDSQVTFLIAQLYLLAAFFAKNLVLTFALVIFGLGWSYLSNNFRKLEIAQERLKLMNWRIK